MNSYKDLIVWQKAIELVKVVYQLTKNFPESERFGLTNQMRRASVSIPSNIAEGYYRHQRNEYRRFCLISLASGAELETQIIIAQELQFASSTELSDVYELLTSILKLLNRLSRALENPAQSK
jgi:four helix bundle protein